MNASPRDGKEKDDSPRAVIVINRPSPFFFLSGSIQIRSRKREGALVPKRLIRTLLLLLLAEKRLGLGRKTGEERPKEEKGRRGKLEGAKGTLLGKKRRKSSQNRKVSLPFFRCTKEDIS